MIEFCILSRTVMNKNKTQVWEQVSKRKSVSEPEFASLTLNLQWVWCAINDSAEQETPFSQVAHQFSSPLSAKSLELSGLCCQKVNELRFTQKTKNKKKKKLWKKNLNCSHSFQRTSFHCKRPKRDRNSLQSGGTVSDCSAVRFRRQHRFTSQSSRTFTFTFWEREKNSEHIFLWDPSVSCALGPPPPKDKEFSVKRGVCNHFTAAHKFQRRQPSALYMHTKQDSAIHLPLILFAV